eukprot:jgi/Chlat1/6505/Chrsp45S09069
MEAGAGGDWMVGCRVAVKTTLGDDIQGEVFTFDKSTNCLVLHDAGSKPGTKNMRILKANFIKEVTMLSAPVEPVNLRVPAMDINRLRQREKAAVRQAEVEAERFGVNVTSEAQEVFDALSKTLPVRWEQTTIVVMDEVRIQSPYTAESCSGGPSGTLARVRKVLELERQRLQRPGA